MDEYLRILKRQLIVDPDDEELKDRYFQAFHRIYNHFPYCEIIKNADSEAAALVAYETYVQSYETRYPKYCRKCGGWGGNFTYDGSTGMEDFDPCNSCIELGYCPQCGEATAEMLEEPGEGYYDYFSCPCGWRDDDPNREGMPLPPDKTPCNCY